MATGFIELNDAGINQAVDGKLIYTSPGYAVLDGDQLMVGEQGLKNARLLPRWTNNRFWNQLNNEPIANSTNLVRHHADLAFNHLEQIWANMDQGIEQVVLAVPGFYDRQQLGLLLGMAKETNIPVKGLVDLGLISVAQQPSLQTIFFLDISLHRITVTLLRSDSVLRAMETMTISDTGLFTLWDRWANIIASQFIQSTRYDPMHQADSEQQLFDLLPSWITESSRTNQFELNLDGVTHTTQVSSEQLIGACSTVYPEIVKAIRNLIPPNEAATLFVSHRFQGIPGLKDSLQLIPDLEVDYLSGTAAIEAAQIHWDKLASSGDDVSYITTLPVSAKKASTRVLQQPPTHLLTAHRAYSISNTLRVESLSPEGLVESADDASFTVYQRGKDVFLEAHESDVLLNGQAPASRCVLNAGDQIMLDGQTAVLITVN